MTLYSHCQMCRDPLGHTAVFCPKCGLSACSWDCYASHAASHAAGGSDDRNTVMTQGYTSSSPDPTQSGQPS